MKKLQALAAALLLMGAATPAWSQTIGYAEAIDRLAVACGNDINQHCKTVNLGGGRMQQCLNQNQAKISAPCRTTMVEVAALLQKRATARANVLRICDADARRLCPDVRREDGNLLECFYKAENRASPQCRQAVTDAGFR
jgi:hypothetical protein